ncbi:alpha/beta hydrolase [Microbulbifer sp. 2304DJ12-6]|uniref:alpha/beta hydrolase n=1 Tax=Microbulbifer sp. 2304DJ12-6 TaxID=3233340 RepID=UPI0039B026E7
MLHALKNLSVQLLLLVLFLFSTFSSSAENHKDKIIIGESTRLYSDILGEERAVYISLPSNYHRNIHSYPVIIVMDAEYLFEAASAIVKIKVSRNEMPESIVVGIPNSTGKRYDMAMSLRYPDGSTFFGDADGKRIKDYLVFYRKELFPFLENNYRVNTHKTIIGMSPTFGPVLEAFWNEPDLFDGYIVLAAELAVKTTSGKTIAERLLQAIQDNKRSKSAIYIGKASDDLKRRPKEEALAYVELNQKLRDTANPDINYKIEVLENENHYGMSISGIEHGLENIYPYHTWRVPYREFWHSESPANAIKAFYEKLSKQYGFEIIPLEDSFYAAQTLLGTAKRLERKGRRRELRDLVRLAINYYPNSPVFKGIDSGKK